MQLKGGGVPYEKDSKMTLRLCHENPQVKQIYDNYLDNPGSHKSHELLHTSFIDRSYENKNN